LKAIYESNTEERAELLNAALRDPDPLVVRTGLELVDANESRIENGDVSSIVEFPMEAFLDILLRSNQRSHNESRDRARRLVADAEMSAQTLDQILARLAAILHDPSKQDEHIKAIRVMRQIAQGPRSEKLNAILNSHKAAVDRVFSESEDVQLRALAAWTLYDFDRSRQRINQLQKEAGDLPRDARQQMQQLIEAEEEAGW
jgi:hypothetical protein